MSRMLEENPAFNTAAGEKQNTRRGAPGVLNGTI